MSWFSELFGSEEICSRDNATLEAYHATQALFQVGVSSEADAVSNEIADALGEPASSVGSLSFIAPNGRRFFPGVFEEVSLAEIRRRVDNLKMSNSGSRESEDKPRKSLLSLRNLYETDVRDLFTQKDLAAGSLFQVASQFNYLEFVHAGVTPEHGITGYLFDKTQGPACAMACAAGTLWRNYFVKVRPGTEAEGSDSFQRGQTHHCQFNGLSDVAADLNAALESATEISSTANDDSLNICNGYSSCKNPRRINGIVGTLSEVDRDAFRGKMKFGIQWKTEVTDAISRHIKNPETKKWENIKERVDHRVSQIFCSALALSKDNEIWQPLAELVLEAAYEATLGLAALNQQTPGASKNVFLTFLGAGAFGNETEWILRAIRRALILYQDFDLNVYFVHFGRRGELIEACRELEGEFNEA